MPDPAPTRPASRLTTSMRAMLITVPALILITGILVIVALLDRPSEEETAATRASTPVIEADSHVLDAAGEHAPTLVEFLDFECEVCGMVYPAVEELREEYAGEINYAVRYFPLPGHHNSMNAALAVEAAAQQGDFEGMYRMMFETQGEWGEQQAGEAPRFRGYAETLGLDLDAYDAAIADPATRARVERDFAAGEALGVTGTPTFFLDGEMLEIAYTSELAEAIEAALAER
ncbi:DsbA family protein [Leucobacter sp.]